VKDSAIEALGHIHAVFDTVHKGLCDLHPAGLLRLAVLAMRGVKHSGPCRQAAMVRLSLEDVSVQLGHEAFVGERTTLEQAAIF
jgi:hypothetical protein